MSKFLGWKTATIALNGTASDEVDLGLDADLLQVKLPTLTSGTIKVQVAEEAGGTYQDLGPSITTATTTGAYNTVFKLGGWQHIKIVSSAAQGAARSIKVRGERF